MGKVLELMVNRRVLQIPARSIVYASVTDKLCKIYLDSDETLNLFITISELMEKLGEEDFLRVSRSSLVAYSAVEAVNQDEVILRGGVRIPYSRSRRKEIMEKVRSCVERQIVCKEEGRDIGRLDFRHDFSFWDNVPVGFCVLEFITDESGRYIDFAFRYANRALADIEGIVQESMVENPAGKALKDSQRKWLAIYSKVAFLGESIEFIDYSPEIDKDLLVICYQPAYGYCACIVCDATDKYYLQMNR